VMSNVRTATRADGSVNVYGSGSNVISSPPQAYTSNATTTGNRYPANFNQSQQVSGFEQDNRRNDLGNLYVPMQPDQYQSYTAGGAPPTSAGRQHVPPPAASFYNSSVLSSGQLNPNQTRNPFQVGDGQQQQQQQAIGTVKDVRRGNGGIDAWQR